MFKALRKLLALVYGAAPAPVLQLHVNKSAEPETLRVNLRCTVNRAEIKRGVLHNGRKHTVIPSYTLPDDVVMNGLLYPHSEIEASYKGLEGKLAPLGHPVVDGVYVSAERADAINAHHIGAWNRNVERRGNRIYAEKWVDEDYAANTAGGRKLFEALDKGEPIHTSTGIFLHADLTANGKTSSGKEYRGTARNMVMDHDAILIGEIGAATPDDGVGLMVNTVDVESAEPLTVNEVLSKLSYGSISRMLNEAATLKWGGEDKWVWVEDFDTTTAIVHIDKVSNAIDYSVKDGVVTFSDSKQPVQQKTEWVDKLPAVNRILQWLKFGVNSEPDTKPTAEGELEMTPEELAAALSANNAKLMESVNAVVAPVAAAVTELKANHAALSDALTANARAAEADKRKVVAEKFGKTVADALTGNALDEMHAKCVGAAPLLPGFQPNSDADGFQTTKLPE